MVMVKLYNNSNITGKASKAALAAIASEEA